MRTFNFMKQFLVFSTLAAASGGSAPMPRSLAKPSDGELNNGWLQLDICMRLAFSLLRLAEALSATERYNGRM